MSESQPSARPAPDSAPEGLSPFLWETARNMGLSAKILSDLHESPEMSGGILIDAADHLEVIGRAELAQDLLEAVRVHPPTRLDGQVAALRLIELFRDGGQHKEADALVEELNGSELEPGPACLLAMEFQVTGRLDEALRCFNIAADEWLTGKDLAGASMSDLMPLVGRAQVRKQLGMAADELDRAAQDMLFARAQEGPEYPDEEWDEPFYSDAELFGRDDEPLSPDPGVRGATVAFSRASLARARELGMVGTQVTEADHYLDAERELRAAARRHPGTLFAVVTADADEVAAFAERRGLDPSEESTRGAWVEALPSESPKLLPWPPARNQACWCSSGRKYKKCCGSPAAR